MPRTRRRKLNPGQAVRAKLTPADIVRFLSKVEVSEELTSGHPCWKWTAHVDSNGYGQVKVDGKARWVHRVAWEMFHNRALPDGFDVDHRCHCTSCVNPKHLRAVPRVVNSARNQPVPF